MDYILHTGVRNIIFYLCVCKTKRENPQRSKENKRSSRSKVKRERSRSAQSKENKRSGGTESQERKPTAFQETELKVKRQGKRERNRNAPISKLLNPTR